jgi:hypothetical protein
MMMNTKDNLDICYEKECENYGVCALDALLPEEVHRIMRPKCHYYYIKQKGIKFRGEDDHELSDEELWNVFSYPATNDKKID